MMPERRGAWRLNTASSSIGSIIVARLRVPEPGTSSGFEDRVYLHTRLLRSGVIR
jgi:hypothetical protein